MRYRGATVITGIALAVALGAAACGGGTQSASLSARGHEMTNILAGIAPKSASDQFELDMATRQQQLDVTCMAAHQLHYIARDPHSLVDTVTETDFTSLDYAKTYGFGVTTFPHLTGVDPNAATLAAMSSAQQDAYTKQLVACDDAANQQTNKEYDVDDANQVFNEIDQDVQNDPRYRDAVAAWHQCASAVGYQDPDRTSLISRLRDRMGVIRDDLSTTAAKSGAPSDATVASLAEHDTGFQQLHQEEVTAAVATFPCSQRLDATYRDVYRSHETSTGQPKH